jgi:outer membrane protein assembly factor BamB
MGVAVPLLSRTVGVVAATALALALTSCATTDPDPSPTASPGPVGTESVTPGAGPTPAATVQPYPGLPTIAWTFPSAEGALPPGSDGVLYAPTGLTSVTEGYVSPVPVDAGDLWVTATRNADQRPVLVGVAADSGDPQWTYDGDGSDVTGCADTLLDGSLVCAVTATDDDGHRAAAVVRLDPRTGSESGRFDLPATPASLQVIGSDVVVLAAVDPAEVSEAAPRPYLVGRYAGTGDERWTTELVYTPGSLGRGPWEDLEVTESLVGVELHGSVAVLDSADGEVLARQDGLGWEWTPTPDGGLLVDASPTAEPSVTVLDPNGDAIATLAGYREPAPVVDGATPVLLVDAEGDLVRLDTATGATQPTGVAASEAIAASLVGDSVLLLDDTALRGYSLTSPSADPWEAERTEPSSAVTDAARVYTSASGADGAAVVALDVSDGSTVWRLPLEPTAASSATTVRVGDRLVVVDGSTILTLDP